MAAAWSSLRLLAAGSWYSVFTAAAWLSFQAAGCRIVGPRFSLSRPEFKDSWLLRTLFLFLFSIDVSDDSDVESVESGKCWKW